MSSSDLSMRFVSQDSLDEKRKRRQEEWEQKRKPEDPLGISSGYTLQYKYPLLCTPECEIAVLFKA